MEEQNGNAPEVNGNAPEQNEISAPPVVDFTELESKITDLVEVLEAEQEQKKVEAEKQVEEEKQNTVEAEKQLQEEQKELDQEAKVEAEQKKKDEEFKQSVLKSLGAVNGETVDYSKQLQEITSRLDTIIEIQNKENTSDVILGMYGYVFIPILVVIYGGWKMIKHFV